MEPGLSRGAVRTARGYFRRRRLRIWGNMALLLVILGVVGTLVVPPLRKLGALPLLAVVMAAAVFLFFWVLRRQQRRQAQPPEYLVQVRPLLARELYPRCTFSLLGSRVEIAARLEAGAAQVFRGALQEYGGTLTLSTPEGPVLAHDITEERGDTDSSLYYDWVVYEYALPAGNRWREISFAQITCSGPDSSSGPHPGPLAGALRRVFSRRAIPRAGGLEERPVPNTPLTLLTGEQARCQALLAGEGAAPLLRFFRENGPGYTVCYCQGTLFVFSYGRRLDQRWTRTGRFQPDLVLDNARAVRRAMPMLPSLV